MDAAVKGRYTVRLAAGEEEIDELLRLRYRVFNLELGEGLESSTADGRDQDQFDQVCQHMVVIENATGAIIGTYRLQSHDIASRGFGFYTGQEFDLSTVPEDVLRQSVELGRACIDRAHRSGRVLFLLWRALTSYLADSGCRYFFGCSSLPGTDMAYGQRVFRFLSANGLLHDFIRVNPLPGHQCIPGDVVPEDDDGEVIILPTLMQLYFNYGVRACGPPAVDRLFKTIDFFVLFDKEALDSQQRRVLFG